MGSEAKNRGSAPPPKWVGPPRNQILATPLQWDSLSGRNECIGATPERTVFVRQPGLTEREGNKTARVSNNYMDEF